MHEHLSLTAGRIGKLGRSFARSRDYDAMGERLPYAWRVGMKEPDKVM